MTKKILALVLTLAVMGSALAGCGGKATTSSGATESTATSAKPAEAKTLSVYIGPEPESIDPALNNTVDGGTLTIHAFEGLTKRDVDGKIVNGQAKEIKVSTDLLTYTVTLRDDIKWSDGKAVTASDFVYAWQRVVDPKTASPYNYMFDPIVNATDIYNGVNKDLTALGVKAIDDKTLEIKLSSPCAYFDELLAFPTYLPIRKDAIEAGGEKWTQDPKTYISNGPYVLSNWSHKESMTYTKNPNYYDKDKIASDSIKFVLIEDDSAALAAYQNNEIQYNHQISQDELDAWKDKPDYKNVPQLGTYFICYNTTKAPFDNPKVRKALSLAIDRNYLVEKVTKGGQIPADAFVSTGVSDVDISKEFHTVGGGYFSVKPEDYDKNVAEAKKLLTEAGYPDGKGLPAFEYMFNAGSGHQAIAEALQNMWKTALGVNATLSSQEWAVFTKTRQNGGYQVARHGWLADYNDPISYLDMWVTKGGNNDSRWSNKEYDGLIKEVKSTNDQTVRMADMHKAEKILMDEMPVAPLYFYTHSYLINTNIKNFYESPLGFDYFMYASVE